MVLKFIQTILKRKLYSLRFFHDNRKFTERTFHCLSDKTAEIR